MEIDKNQAIINDLKREIDENQAIINDLKREIDECINNSYSIILTEYNKNHIENNSRNNLIVFKYLEEVNKEWDKKTVSLFHILNVQESSISHIIKGKTYEGFKTFLSKSYIELYLKYNLSKEYYTDLTEDPNNYKEQEVTLKRLNELVDTIIKDTIKLEDDYKNALDKLKIKLETSERGLKEINEEVNEEVKKVKINLKKEIEEIKKNFETVNLEKYRNFSKILEEAINISYYINHFLIKFIRNCVSGNLVIDKKNINDIIHDYWVRLSKDMDIDEEDLSFYIENEKKELFNILNNSTISFLYHGRNDIFYTEVGTKPFILPLTNDIGSWSEFGNGLYTTADIQTAEGYGDAAISRTGIINGETDENKSYCLSGSNILKISYGSGTADSYKNTKGILMKEIRNYNNIFTKDKVINFFNHSISQPDITFIMNMGAINFSEIIFLEKYKLNVNIIGFKNKQKFGCEINCEENINNIPTTIFYNSNNEEKKYKLKNCKKRTYKDIVNETEHEQFYYKYLKYKQKYEMLKKSIN